MYGRILNNSTELGLPTAGILLDGRTVSNYHLLPEKTLLEEGWLPCEEVKPEFDEATQYLEVDTAVDNGSVIVVTYKAVDIPVDELSAMEDLLLSEMGV